MKISVEINTATATAKVTTGQNTEEKIISAGDMYDLMTRELPLMVARIIRDNRNKS